MRTGRDASRLVAVALGPVLFLLALLAAAVGGGGGSVAAPAAARASAPSGLTASSTDRRQGPAVDTAGDVHRTPGWSPLDPAGDLPGLVWRPTRGSLTNDVASGEDVVLHRPVRAPPGRGPPALQVRV